jgi:hypothetical protein
MVLSVMTSICCPKSGKDGCVPIVRTGAAFIDALALITGVVLGVLAITGVVQLPINTIGSYILAGGSFVGFCLLAYCHINNALVRTVHKEA